MVQEKPKLSPWTWLRAERARTSWKLMPIASGASKVRTTVPSPTPGRRMSFSTRCSSHLIRTYVRIKVYGGRTTRADVGARLSGGACLSALERGQLGQRLGAGFGAERRQQGDQVAFRAEGL